jgi:tetratricopeptide (TPR) repeat protein
VFLRRVTTHPATDPEVRLGQGAFLVLRLADLLSPDRDTVQDDAFRYQWAATERYCTELEVEGPEGVHLSGLVHAVKEVHRQNDPRLLSPVFLAYALFLEEAAHYDEAADALETLLRVGGDRLSIADRTAAWLRLGRARRKVARFDEADQAYVRAAELAANTGDASSVLLSRLGQANVLHGRGNLAEGERALRAILEDAQRQSLRTIEALAHHQIGSLLDVRGQVFEGIPHLWKAYELYEDDASRLRALSDLGMDFLAMGDADSAERALTEVVRRSSQQEAVLNAMVELMHSASYRRDRLTFGRRRAECEARVADMPPNVLTDYCLKAGIGFARFGNFNKARGLLAEALAIAAEHGLHEFEFRIERIQSGLEQCQTALREEEAILSAEPVAQPPAVREVSASLAALAV